MACLVLRDVANGQEISREPMAPQRRYDLYRLMAEHECFCFAGKRWHIHSVAWRIPEEECVLGLVFEDWETPPFQADDC